MNTSKDSTEAFLPGQMEGDREPVSNLSPQGWSYERTVTQVEIIMSRIESGELELAEVFDQFAAAVSYLRQCEQFLTQRQQQMDLLIETLSDEPE